MNEEHLFDKDSFQDEITSTSEAKASYDYFTANLTAFRHELSDAGLGYVAIEKEVRQCWENLLESSKRVGFSNSHIERMAERYGLIANKK